MFGHFLGKQKTNRILIYPFAHLSSNLSQPSEALKIIKDMEAYAKEKGIETYRAPFGWNKQFTISIKGHPLAEQARCYAPAPVAAAEAKAEGECQKRRRTSFSSPESRRQDAILLARHPNRRLTGAD